MAEKTESIPEGLISKTEFFDASTPITKVVPSVFDCDAVIINKGKEYFGIIDSRVIYRQTGNLSLSASQKAEKFAIKVPRITDTTPIDDVVYYFHKSRARALPYFKNDRIRGILRRTTLIKMLLSIGKLSDTTVREAMVAPLIGIEITSTVANAKAAMRSNRMNRLAVLDNGRFVGIVTNNDLVRQSFSTQERIPAMTSEAYKATNVPLENFVRRNPISIEQSRGLSDAARLMLEKGVSSLIVTRGDRPIGMVTELDIIESAMARSGLGGEKIFISGLDSETYQYEDELREELRSFVNKMEKLSRVNIEYISLVVKKFKTKSYEMHGRVSLGNQGIINAHVTGHIFERTLRDVLEILSRDIRKKKERYLTIRRVLYGAHPEEEVE